MQSCTLCAAFQDSELVTQSNDFKPQIVARSTETSQPGEYDSYNQSINPPLYQQDGGSCSGIPANGILVTYNQSGE